MRCFREEIAQHETDPRSSDGRCLTVARYGHRIIDPLHMEQRSIARVSFATQPQRNANDLPQCLSWQSAGMGFGCHCCRPQRHIRCSCFRPDVRNEQPVITSYGWPRGLASRPSHALNRGSLKTGPKGRWIALIYGPLLLGSAHQRAAPHNRANGEKNCHRSRRNNRHGLSP